MSAQIAQRFAAIDRRSNNSILHIKMSFVYKIITFVLLYNGATK
jgi:hypothetical protein